MTKPQTTTPQITTSSTGVRQVKPSEILGSVVGQDQIRKTAEAVAARTQKSNK